MSKNNLSTQSYKGARDFYPEDMRIRSYIFETWRKVCKKYGYEEYDFPILEPLEIFAAKTGEEIVKTQLFSFEDGAGRKLAIRPELTPGTVRMLAAKYKELQRPVRWFMIGNNWRYEKPQLGRGREFYQLEVNIFGVENVLGDFEIFSLIIDLMEAFGAKENMYKISVSDRRLIECLLKEALKLTEDQSTATRRLMDKKSKMSKEQFEKGLNEIGLEAEQINKIETFMTSKLTDLNLAIPQEMLENNKGYQNLVNLFSLLESQQIDGYVEFDPSIIRGFDYSDGLVYEVFDQNPNNNRSMFGGERFDKLINIFGEFDLAATGFAMGDITLLEFLKGWDLLPDLPTETKYFVTTWPGESAEFLRASMELASTIRNYDQNVELWLNPNTKLEKQLRYANKKAIPYVVIIGEEELKNNTITVKDMANGEQTTTDIEKWFAEEFGIVLRFK